MVKRRRILEYPKILDNTNTIWGSAACDFGMDAKILTSSLKEKILDWLGPVGGLIMAGSFIVAVIGFGISTSHFPFRQQDVILGAQVIEHSFESMFVGAIMFVAGWIREGL